jgi:hypothetical protein
LRTFSQILVDVDVRASHHPALDAGVTIASATGAELTVVDVVTPTEIGGMLPSIQRGVPRLPRRRLDDIVTAVDAVPAHPNLLLGAPEHGGDAQRRSGRSPIDPSRHVAAGDGDGLQQLLMVVSNVAVARQIPLNLLTAQRPSADVLAWDLDATVVGFRTFPGADAESHDRRDHQHDHAGAEDPGQRAFSGQGVDEHPERHEHQQQKHICHIRHRNSSQCPQHTYHLWKLIDLDKKRYAYRSAMSSVAFPWPPIFPPT